MKRILIMGLPGSGKTTLAAALGARLFLSKKFTWFNADAIREKYNDWDFSDEGRLRQANRMRELADKEIEEGQIAICDFVAPTNQIRQIFDADVLIWLDTIEQGRFEDTNKIFEPPKSYDFRITEKDAEKWADFIADHILNDKRRPVFDHQKETVQMLGRWQPWHKGHRALFEEAIAKTGQVCIMIRDCQGWNGSNPFTYEQVTEFIKRDLDPLYQGQYQIIVVPNIVEIVYGRDVGYKITQIELSPEVQKISATNIRKEMGLE